jgi:hypothetical protein
MPCACFRGWIKALRLSAAARQCLQAVRHFAL